MVQSSKQVGRGRESGITIFDYAIQDVGVTEPKRVRELAEQILKTCVSVTIETAETSQRVLDKMLRRHTEFRDVDTERLFKAIRWRAAREAPEIFSRDLRENPDKLVLAPDQVLLSIHDSENESDRIGRLEAAVHELAATQSRSEFATKSDIRALSEKIDRLAAAIEAQDEASLEQRLEARVNKALDEDWRDVEDKIVEDNVALRQWFLDNVDCLTSADIHRMAEGPEGNTSEPASRWRREGKIFGVKRRGRYLYPAFEFENGEPKRAIREILESLPDDMREWDRALWFTSANGWLDGPAPMDMIDTNKGKVVEAAQHEAEYAIG